MSEELIKRLKQQAAMYAGEGSLQAASLLNEAIAAIESRPAPEAGRVAELEQKLSEQRRISVELNDQCVDYCRRIAALESRLAESQEREGRMRAGFAEAVDVIRSIDEYGKCKHLIAEFEAALAADKEQK